ncbi:MarR family winged helix-turn-helix transcriptional regulator [Actinoplanes sp. NPDC049668]|uniref:MarR family winged helix-turn-helix transcriptional regulator n=1 Tax=unclassified Actinoplanes TaxID=2626549 RepID=UPI0033A0E661
MDDLPSRLLTRTAALAHRLVTERFAELGARGYHYRLLTTLIDDGPASQADLGRRTGIHFSDMVAALNELTDGGYVERRPDPADRRRNTVTVTPLGHARAAALAQRAAEIQEELLAPLSAAERGELVRLLRLVSSAAGEG